MKTGTTEIRRLANGLIDTAYYIRRCHRERSLAAHRAIGLSFNAPRELIEVIAQRLAICNIVRKAPEPAE